MVLISLALISGLSFAFYGVQTIFGERPRAEFERYGIPGLRKFVGSMQLLGAAGVMFGLVYSPIGALAAGGLTTMMVLGLVVRVKIHDAPRAMVPAASLAVMNAVLVAMFLAQ
ncbi:MAG: DoxX family protein [Acidimicrobiales bacterium]